MRDFSENLGALRKRLDEAGEYLRIDELRANLVQLETEASRPDLWDDPDQARKITSELSAANDDLALHAELETMLEDAETLAELAREEGDDSVESEVDTIVANLDRRFGELELRALFRGEWDDHDAVAEVHAGEGGTDSADFAEMLLRMYQRWAERSGFGFELDDVTPGTEAGISSATFIIRGRHAYGRLRSEKGTHRLVRISPFNAQGKRQTAFAAFSVVPLMQEGEVDIEIDDKDLRVDVYRSSGAGGQHVNKTDSAVRLTHLPTGVVVACQNERSQTQNKAKAMQILQARLADLERQRRSDELAAIAGPKDGAGFGNRIRSYVLHPYQQVKDERTGYEVGDVSGVLDGDVDGLMEAFLRWESAGSTDTADDVGNLSAT
ncbi:MAG: peptide chain release factor 2 [Acidimicrobiia bacterium]|nr:peptide chain release factor 2 [Acidimicrobiia bacterium]